MHLGRQNASLAQQKIKKKKEGGGEEEERKGRKEEKGKEEEQEEDDKRRKGGLERSFFLGTQVPWGNLHCSAGEGTCCQVKGPEFESQHPRDRQNCLSHPNNNNDNKGKNQIRRMRCSGTAYDGCTVKPCLKEERARLELSSG